MNLFRHRVLRLPIVALGAMAWLAVSNHCVIASLEGARKAPTPSCHQMPDEGGMPARHHHDNGIECCKVLRSTLLTISSSLAAYDAISFALHDYVVAILPIVEDAQTSRVIEWDTGPPGLGSFAESVLQRSILAHAPPFLA